MADDLGLLHGCGVVCILNDGNGGWLLMQALVQFSDANTASAAKSALEGRSIPRYDIV